MVIKNDKLKWWIKMINLKNAKWYLNLKINHENKRIKYELKRQKW